MEKEILFEKISAEEETVKASGSISPSAEFFQDHFPDFPILPGVLAVEILKRTAEYGMFQKEEGAKQSLLCAVKAVKFARYLKPGDTWQSEVKLLKKESNKYFWKGYLTRGDETAVSAKLELTA